jgi:hypothetical protein
MHSSKHRRQLRRSNKTTRAPLKVVLVYDGFTDLIRAHEMWSGLVARFKNEMQIVGRAWNFSLLRDPRLRLRAALHTAEANMVVFSASGRSELPDHIRNWIGAWMPWKKGRRDALVAMLDHPTPVSATAPGLLTYLRRIAAQCDMDFFCSSGSPPTRMAAGAGAIHFDGPQERSDQSFPVHDQGPDISRRGSLPRGH